MNQNQKYVQIATAIMSRYFLSLEYRHEDLAHHAVEAVNDVSIGAVRPLESHFGRDVSICYFTVVVGFQEKQAMSVQTLSTKITPPSAIAITG